ncbi:MAG: cell division protein FtsZ [Treponema sp.]|nr:cell division protein FtsZ [Treponema sp.]
MNVLAVRELQSPQMAVQNAAPQAAHNAAQILQFKTQEVSKSPLKLVTPNAICAEKESAHYREIVPAVIKVISSGGAGMNAVNRMIDAKLSGIEFISANTDIQELLNRSRADVKVQIGARVTGGLGAGGKPQRGEQAAIEDSEAIADVLKGANMVFVTAGMGGGTGTGSAHVIAKIAKQLGALTVGVVTMPFDFEGRYKMSLADEGIEKLRAEVDALIVIRNQNLFKIIDSTTHYSKAYLLTDDILCQAVQGISEIITETGYQNTDFADVKAIMEGKGDALMGIGLGAGENRAIDAVNNAIDNPLLEDTSIEGATGILVNIVGPMDMTLVEIQNIIKTVKDKCDQDVHLIPGVRYDSSFDNCFQVTVIATGFKEVELPKIEEMPEEKPLDTEFIDYNEYVMMVEKTKRPEYLSCLPPREYREDLEVPSIIRNYNFKMEEKSVLELTE